MNAVHGTVVSITSHAPRGGKGGPSGGSASTPVGTLAVRLQAVRDPDRLLNGGGTGVLERPHRLPPLRRAGDVDGLDPCCRSDPLPTPSTCSGASAVSSR